MSERKPSGYWKDEQNVLREIAAWRAEHEGKFPTQTLLDDSGDSTLAKAIYSFGGFRKLREKEGEKQLRQTGAIWANFERVRAAIEAWRTEHGRYPGKIDLHTTGYSSLSRAISERHGGSLAVRQRLGNTLGKHPNGYWKEFENVRTYLEEYRQAHGRLPTRQDLVAAKRTSVSSAITTYHGGFAAVRERLGFGPVTDDLIATHADALARIVPKVGESTTLWSAMKSRWTRRDLDAAIAAFGATGSTGAFSKLLDVPSIPPGD